MTPDPPPPAPERPRIADVADLAGVSTATVSRVLNGSSRVSEPLRRRVKDAAQQLGYRPYGPAQALRQRTTRVWSAIVADIENPFFTGMVRGVEDVAVREGYRLVLCNSDEDVTKEAAYLDIAIAEQVAGVVIAVASTTGSALGRLVDRGIPVVAVDRRPVVEGFDSVLVDNRLGGDLATEHLLAMGAQRIACVTGPARLSTAADRLDGYRDALVRHGHPVDPLLLRWSDYRQEGGYHATRSLLTGTPRPDALFVANNLMTIGALHAVRHAGLRIPEDVAVVGFDDAPWTTVVTPQLTVVAQPTREIGRQAAQLLAAARPGNPSQHVMLAPTLLVRDSSRR